MVLLGGCFQVDANHTADYPERMRRPPADSGESDPSRASALLPVSAVVVATALLLASAPEALASPDPLSVVLWLLLSGSGGAALLRPAPSAVVVGGILTIAVLGSAVDPGLGVFAAPIALAACAARSSARVVALIGAWYFTALLVPTVCGATQASDIVNGAIIWLVLLGSSAGIGAGFRALAEQVDARTSDPLAAWETQPACPVDRAGTRNRGRVVADSATGHSTCRQAEEPAAARQIHRDGPGVPALPTRVADQRQRTHRVKAGAVMRTSSFASLDLGETAKVSCIVTDPVVAAVPADAGGITGHTTDEAANAGAAVATITVGMAQATARMSRRRVGAAVEGPGSPRVWWRT